MERSPGCKPPNHAPADSFMAPLRARRGALPGRRSIVGEDMIRSYWYLVPITAALGLAAMGPYGTPLLVLAVALGIFFGTVSLRGHRARDATSTHPGV